MGRTSLLACIGCALAATALWSLASQDEAGKAPTPAVTTAPQGTPASHAAADLPAPLPGSQPTRLGDDLPVAPAPAEPVADVFTVDITATLSAHSKQQPASGASLDVGVSRSLDELGEPLVTVVTDESGRAQVELPRAAIAALGGADDVHVWVRSMGPGLLTRSNSSRPSDPGAAPLKLRLHLQPGVLIEGRILDPQGQPAAGLARLWNFAAKPFSDASAKAGIDGKFTLEAKTEGSAGILAQAQSTAAADEHHDLEFRQVDLGTGFSELVEVRFDAPPPPIDVYVSGPGILRGHVTDEQGLPAVGLVLSTFVDTDNSARGSIDRSYSSQFRKMLEGRGLTWSWTTTDETGAFEMRGLRADLYFLMAEMDFGNGRDGSHLFTERPVPAQGQQLALRLTRTYLAIHVRHADGSTPTEVIDPSNGSRWRREDAWPDDLSIQVTLAPGSTPSWEYDDFYRQTNQHAVGEFVVELHDDTVVDVSLFGGGLPWTTRRVVVPAGAGRVDVEMTLPEATRSGTLQLDVLSDTGEPLTDDVRVRVMHPDSGVVLIDMDCTYLDADDWPLQLTLPHGAFQVLVEGMADVNWSLGTLAREREHGGFTAPVQITAGSVTPLLARLSAGARLDLRLDGQVHDSDRLAVRIDAPDADAETIERSARFVSLWVVHAERWPASVEFASDWGEGTTSEGTHLLSGLELGTRATSELLTPGDYTLVARTVGGREVRRPVHLLPGQTLSVTLTFE